MLKPKGRFWHLLDNTFKQNTQQRGRPKRCQTQLESSKVSSLCWWWPSFLVLVTSSQLLPLGALHFVVPSSTLWHRPFVARCGRVDLEPLGWKWWKMVRCNDLSLHCWKESRNNLNLLVFCYIWLRDHGTHVETEGYWTQMKERLFRRKNGDPCCHILFLDYCSTVFSLALTNVHPFPLLPNPPQQRWETLWLYPLWDHFWFALCHFRVSWRRVTFWDKSDVTFPEYGASVPRFCNFGVQVLTTLASHYGFHLLNVLLGCLQLSTSVAWDGNLSTFYWLSFPSGLGMPFVPPSTSLMTG